MFSKYTEEQLVRLLQMKAKSLGRTPTEIDIASDSSMPSVATYRCRFKSWNKALEKAELLPNRFSTTDEELIDLLKKKANCLGRTPMVVDVNSDCAMPSINSYKNRFGSWNKALKVAGLLPNRFHITDEELIDFLKAKAESLGRTPNQRDVKYDRTMPSLNTYVNKFGSWNRALKEAGLSVNVGRTNEELIDLLKAKAESLGRTPTIRDINSDKSMPSTMPYIKIFGSWNQALKAAGLTPNHVRCKKTS